MPFILKKSNLKSKGVIVFTHKERDFLESRISVLDNAFSELKKRYIIGMHWGHFYSSIGDIPYVDFHLAGKGTVIFNEGIKAAVIPLSSRNFIPSCFYNKHNNKCWDVINISRPITLKNLDQFFQVIKKIYKRGYMIKVLLICTCPYKITEKEGWYEKIYDDYLEIFSPEEKKYFTLLMLRGDGYPFPLSPQSIADFYNLSKMFAMFSDKEGESRVIAEALLCGLPVIVKKELKGGGRDYLTPENSRQFSSLDEGVEMIVDMIKNYKKFKVDTDVLKRDLSEKYTTKILEKELKKIFANLEIDFRGKIDLADLSRKLPGHFIDLPIELRRSATNDLNSNKSALIFINSLLEKETPYNQILALEIERRTKYILNLFVLFLRKLDKVINR